MAEAQYGGLPFVDKAIADGGCERLCPICNAPIPRARLMCRDHWAMVSRDLQRRVNATWTAFRRSDYGIAAILAARTHDRACSAAIQEVLRIVKSPGAKSPGAKAPGAKSPGASAG